MTHTHVGATIVGPVVNGKIPKMIEHHHDHYDGNGLHQVIAGNDIPLEARILAVADAFDAMISHRPYRAAMPVAKPRRDKALRWRSVRSGDSRCIS